MADTDNKKNRFNNILTDLASDNTKKVLTALKQLRKHGKPEAIKPIIDVLTNTKDEAVKQEITTFLYDLKDESTIQALIDLVENEKYAASKSLLISIFWQSALDGSNHLSFFIQQAVKGDYMTCIECLTVIENFDATFQEEEIMDATYDLSEAIENEDSEKKNLLISLHSVVSSLNMEM